MDERENVELVEPASANKLQKPPKRGIIYLSSIPPYMNVTRIREVFGEFGTLGRVYLQLAEQGWLITSYNTQYNRKHYCQ